MKHQYVEFKCDLCSFRANVGEVLSEGNHLPPRWVEIDLGTTDPAGHFIDDNKHLCPKCLSKINTALCKP